MSSRAERRRAEREESKPEHKASGSRADISTQLRSHTLFCKPCQSKVYSGKPCRWMVKFYGRNQEIMDRLVNPHLPHTEGEHPATE